MAGGIQLKPFDPDAFGVKKAIMDPAAVLAAAGIKPGMIAADFGSGVGFFAIPTAMIVGGAGKVYAVDINRDFTSALNKRANEAGLGNIETVVANLEKLGPTNIPDSTINVVLIFNVMHQSQLRKEIMAEAKRILAKDGKMVVIDWKKEKTPLGPDLEIRVSDEQIKNIAKELDFKFLKPIETDIYHYGLEFSR